MRKYLFVTAFIFICHIPALCQTFTELRRSDSLRLDSVKRMLPLLKDSAKVDALNTIGIAFGYFAPGGGFNHKQDSMLSYGSRAYDEAKKIGYKTGIATALLILSVSEVSQNLTKDKAEKEKRIREALRLGEEINNHSLIGKAFYALAMFPTIRKDVRLREEYFQKAILHLKKAGDLLPLAEILNWSTAGYLDKNEYLKAFEFADQSVKYSKQVTSLNHNWDIFLVQYSLSNMAELYKAVGDYQTALDYLKQANQYGIVHQSSWIMENEIGDLYKLMGEKDSARYYLQKSIIKGKTPPNPYATISLGRTYLALEDYSKALPLLQRGVDNLKKRIESPGFGSVLLDLSKAYLGKRNYPAALKYAKEGLAWAQKNKDAAPYLLQTSYELLSDIYKRLKKDDLAYNYLRQYHILKDSLQQRQSLFRLHIELYKYKQASEEEKKETRIGYLQRDNKIKRQQLQQETFIRNSLIGGLALLFLIGVFAFRNLHLKRKNERLRLRKDMELQKLESEQKQTKFQRQAVELEMQALRAQMNPHFIFNCLSSINRFILKNESKAASKYLTRFSRLMRMVLINSKKPLISLDDELQMLRLYLEMERLRFKNTFSYRISFLNEMDADNLFIPPLLLQPFCENAIWHGLMNKDGEGMLEIDLENMENFLKCTITDNGVGRKKAGELKTKTAEKEKSMGLKITSDRLSLINQENNIQSFFKIEDLANENGEPAGTKVMFNIRCSETAEMHHEKIV
jgi:hypothetical protein